MAVFTTVIFVCQDNLCQSPIAEAILKEIKKDEWLEVKSRGIVVLFEEPYSLKAYNLLRNNGMRLKNGTSCQLKDEEFSDNTLVLTMNREQKKRVLAQFDNAINVYSIMEFVDKEGDIVDPYGGDNDLYAMFFTSVRSWVDQVEIKLHELNFKEELK